MNNREEGHADSAVQELERAFEAEDFEAVLKLSMEVLQSNPKNPAAWHRKALAELKLGQVSEFRQTLDEALAEVANPDPFFLVKALGLFLIEDYEGACEAAEEAVSVDPDNAAAWKILTDATFMARNFGRAQEAAERAVELSGEEKRNSYTKTLARASGANGDFPSALKATEYLIENAEPDAAVLSMKAAALVQLDRFNDALVSAEQAYGLEPESIGVLRALSASLALSGNYKRGAEIFQEWLNLEPSSPEAWMGVGLVSLMQGEWEQAASALDRAIELNPDEVLLKVWRALALIEIGEAENALAILSEVSVSNPDIEEVWLGRSVAERALGFYEEAIGSARKALEISDFRSSRGWLELARSYSAASRHSNAWRAFSKAIQLKPKSFDAALGRAVESILCKSETRALQELQEAESENGTHALIEFNRGVALYKLGREGQAREAWEKARELDPELAAADVLAANGGEASGVPGSWTDYWFGVTATRGHKAGGWALLVLLILFLILPLLEPDLICLLETGNSSFERFIPALVVTLLLLLPAIRSLAVGGVSLDVAPLGSPPQGPSIDPAQVLPVFARNELDVTRLTRR